MSWELGTVMDTDMFLWIASAKSITGGTVGCGSFALTISRQRVPYFGRKSRSNLSLTVAWSNLSLLTMVMELIVAFGCGEKHSGKMLCLNIGLVTVFSFLERATDRYIYGSEQVMETFMVQNKWWRVHYVALKQRVFSGQHQELATTDLG
jgi:hypothetical protein